MRIRGSMAKGILGSRLTATLGVTLGAVLLLAGVLGASAAAAAPETVEEGLAAESLVVAVEVPVQVTLSGEALRGLGLKNFEILEDGKPQAITGFETVDLALLEQGPAAAAALPAAELPAQGRRHILLLFDLAFSRPPGIAKAQEAARQILRDRLHPADLVAVASYTTSRGVTLLLGFTPDREQALAALDALGRPEVFDRNPDPLRLTLAEAFGEFTSQKASGGAAWIFERGERSEMKAEMQALRSEEMLSQAQLMSQSSDRAQRAHATEAVRDFAESWTALSRVLAEVQGRKLVLYLSEGFDAGLLGGAPTDRVARRSEESGELWTVDSDQKFGSGRAQNQLVRLIEELRRADCVVHAVDIGGLRGVSDIQAQAIGGEPVSAIAGATRVGGEDSLFVLARDTGGELVSNVNDLDRALETVLRRTSVTYVLSYQPVDPRSDGAYHRLVVRLKNAPRGARVSHRSGYYAPRPFVDKSAAERNNEAAQRLVTGIESGDLDADVAAFLLPSREAAANATVDVAVPVDILGRSLLVGHWGEDLSLQIYVYAFNENGGLADYLAQRLDLDLQRTFSTLQAGGVKFLGLLRLPAGRYSIRTLARNERTGRFALRRADLVVPASTSGVEPALFAPLVPDPRPHWLAARSPRWARSESGAARQPSSLGLPPFLARGKAFLPVAQPLLPGGGGEIYVWAPAANLPEGSFAARASWVDDRGGATPALAEVMSLERPGLGSLYVGGVLLKVRVDPAFAPGRHKLRVELENEGGVVWRSPAAPIEIGGVGAGAG